MVQQWDQTHLLKKKKKRVKKPKNIGNSFQVNISLLTKQKKPKSVFLNKSQIPCTKTKKQKNKKITVTLLHRRYLYLFLHLCSPYFLESNCLVEPLVSLTLSHSLGLHFIFYFLYSLKLYCRMLWLYESIEEIKW